MWTPGPWYVVPRDPDVGGNLVYADKMELPIAIVPLNRRPTQDGPNAHLIAAAPDLAKACELALKRLGELNRNDEVGIRTVLSVALAKARGE